MLDIFGKYRFPILSNYANKQAREIDILAITIAFLRNYHVKMISFLFYAFKNLNVMKACVANIYLTGPSKVVTGITDRKEEEVV